MTIDPLARPFITAFATRIERACRQTLRYDEQRQLSQVLLDGTWVDAVTTPVVTAGGTCMTKVAQETTDDA
jgi:hypothetical protein